MTESPSKCPHGETAVDERDDAVSMDTLFDLLADRRRRTVLERLCAVEGPLVLADVAGEVAARELNASAEVPAEPVDRIYATLYHSHVPRLVDEGVVAYDRDGDTIEALAPIEQFEEFLVLARTGDGQP